MQTVNILGTEYTIERKAFTDDPDFERRSISGYCDGYLKQIVHCDMSTYPGFEKETKELLDKVEKSVLRHEITHAFFNESGLMGSSYVSKDAWAENEEMIDWFAIQSPKIFRVFSELGIID